MLWDEAEATIRSDIETQWALGVYAAIPLVFENESASVAPSFMLVNIEGVYAEKSIYGGAGQRVSLEAGLVFFHCFAPSGGGKQAALSPAVAMTSLLELRTIGGAIKMDGGDPPSPITEVRLRTQGIRLADGLVPAAQPGGNYYRCSGSVPFVVIGTR
jgi:hypothetical protein